MNLQEFTRGMVKEGAFPTNLLRTGKRLWGGLTGSTVKRLEGRVAKAPSERLTQMLAKAKAFQKNVRVGTGIGAGGLGLGYLAGKKSED